MSVAIRSTEDFPIGGVHDRGDGRVRMAGATEGARPGATSLPLRLGCRVVHGADAVGFIQRRPRPAFLAARPPARADAQADGAPLDMWTTV